MLLSPSILLVLASPAALKTPGSFLWLGEAGSYRQPGLLQITADRGEGRRGGGARVCVCGGGTIDSPALLLFHPSTPPRDSAKGLHRCCCRCLWPAVLAGVEESAAGGAQSLSSCLGSVATSGRRRASTARWSGSLLLGDFFVVVAAVSLFIFDK